MQPLDVTALRFPHWAGLSWGGLGYAGLGITSLQPLSHADKSADFWSCSLSCNSFIFPDLGPQFIKICIFERVHF